MHRWTVGGALVESDGGLLLVCNRRRGGRHDWSPPGGVIDAGEELLSGLRREVVEETGLEVVEWSGQAYDIEVEAPGLGWHLRVEAWRAATWEGSVRVGHDPDGIVVDAGFFSAGQCAAHMGSVQPWVSEPVCDWLAGPWTGVRSYRYEIAGSDPASMRVVRR